MGGIAITFIESDGAERTFAGVAIDQTLMEVGRAHGVDGILAECGGGCACATCHVYVDAVWMEAVGRPNDVEAEMLDLASAPRDNSRLSCQIRLSGGLDGLRVTVAPS